jgi:hypothetical protein
MEEDSNLIVTGLRPNIFSFTKLVAKIPHLAAYSVHKDIITYYLGRRLFRCHEDEEDGCNIYNDTLS